MKKYQYLMLGFVGGIALGFLFGRAYGIRTGREMARAAGRAAMGQPIHVVVAAEDLPAGTVLTRRHLGKLRVFSADATGAILPEDAERILGKKTLFSIKARTPVLWPDIEAGQRERSQQTLRGDSETRAEDGAASGAPQP